jgi:hypothetical protein
MYHDIDGVDMAAGDHAFVDLDGAYFEKKNGEISYELTISAQEPKTNLNVTTKYTLH